MTDREFYQKLRAAEDKTNEFPTEAQKETGVYSKGRFQYEGLTFIIENPQGSYRQGQDKDGNRWRQQMHNAYGYFGEAKGVDKDKLDFFIGPNPVTGGIFVVAQNDAEGNFDEHKIMFGFESPQDAKHAYMSNYSPGWKGFRLIRQVTLDYFKNEFMKHSNSVQWLTKHNFV